MMEMTDTLQALRQSKLGRLQYDRDWEQQGRVQEIISGVRNRLTSLSVEPLKSESPPPVSDESDDSIVSPSTTWSKTASPRQTHRRSSIDQSYQAAECDYQHQLDSLERERKEKVRESIAQHAREMSYHMKEMEEEATSMRLMRQRHLLTTLNRIQNYKQEYESFIAELTSSQQQTGTDQTRINEKMREVENKHRKAQLAQRSKTVRDLCADIHATRDQCEAELNKFDTNKEPPSVQQYIGEKRNHIQTLSIFVDALMAKPDLTTYDCQCVEKIAKQLEIIKTSISPEIEQIRKPTQTKNPTPSAGQVTPVKSPQSDVKSLSANTAAKATSGTNPLKDYIRQQAFLTNFEKDIDDSFVKPAEHKPYRLSLQTFIRTTINTISGESTDHLRQKYQRLNDLLSGRTIEFQDKQIRATNHPSALNFCYSYIAKTFISVGVKQVISLPKAAFPIGAIIAVLWQLHPKFGEVFFAHLVEKCPYSIGYFPTQESGDNEITYLIACGYTYGPDNETLETEESFLNRMKALMRLYAAVMQSNLGPGHPQGLATGWRCLARILNTKPRPGVTPCILHALLTTVLFKMLASYRNQAIKLMSFIQSDYIARIEQASSQETKKQSIVQLKMFVEDAAKKMRRNPNAIKPEGMIGDFFFQKSYLNGASKF